MATTETRCCFCGVSQINVVIDIMILSGSLFTCEACIKQLPKEFKKSLVFICTQYEEDSYDEERFFGEVNQLINTWLFFNEVYEPEGMA